VVTEPALGIDKVANRLGSKKGKFVADLQDLMALYDSLSICKFSLFGGVKLEHLAKWFEMVTGIDMDVQELILAGERIYNVKRLLNLRWGVSPKMDTIPKRMLSQAKKEGPSKGNLPPLDRMLEQYYRCRGWDASGGPGPKKREQLGI
jgi:aldehyde:ferredoxin oxidoreductase